MIWRRSATDHIAAIGGFARQWLGGTLLDRLIPVTLLGWGWCMLWFWIGLATGSWETLAAIVFLICPIPWLLWALDAHLDSSQVKTDIAGFARQGAILATRCEYLGGHPQLPHGRFAYLLLEGTKQNPHLSLIFPTEIARSAETNTVQVLQAERFTLPILDVGKMKPEKGSDASVAADIATSINPGAGKLLRPDRLNFVVDYDGPGGRKHKVEFTNFFHGNNEIRNWQNYIICAQAQGDTGIEPHAPWVALPDDPTQTTKELGAAHAFSGNGHEERKSSSAFNRR